MQKDHDNIKKSYLSIGAVSKTKSCQKNHGGNEKVWNLDFSLFRFTNPPPPPSIKMLCYIETSILICFADQLSGFYMTKASTDRYILTRIVNWQKKEKHRIII